MSKIDTTAEGIVITNLTISHLVRRLFSLFKRPPIDHSILWLWLSYLQAGHDIIIQCEINRHAQQVHYVWPTLDATARPLFQLLQAWFWVQHNHCHIYFWWPECYWCAVPGKPLPKNASGEMLWNSVECDVRFCVSVCDLQHLGEVVSHRSCLTTPPGVSLVKNRKLLWRSGICCGSVLRHPSQECLLKYFRKL